MKIDTKTCTSSHCLQGDRIPGCPLVVKLFLPDGSDVAQNLLTRGLVKKSPTQCEGEEEPPQFYPGKRGPGKPKSIKSKRSITETRLEAASREKDFIRRFDTSSIILKIEVANVNVKVQSSNLSNWKEEA